MKKFIEKIGKQLKDAAENAAYESYAENDVFDGCFARVDIDNVTYEVECDTDGAHTVMVCNNNHNYGVEYPNIEQAIAAYLDDNADELATWQDACDNDIYRGVDPGCDPAFPHRGDFERWAYGY
ncbi:MAG: hypothetical protein LIR46_10170 [Bacteroidota bacterium]|nr:hypothetical protein [Bacteroidota bacterium]